MAFAQGRASSYVRSDIGAISPGRWQPAQFLKMMGATSLLNVGTFFSTGRREYWPCSDGEPIAPIHRRVAATRLAFVRMCMTMKQVDVMSYCRFRSGRRPL